MNVSDAIRLKRAVRKFTPDHLPEEVIIAILNAGRRAQSSKNTQPWHFIAITDKEILKQLSECGEMPWAWPCFPKTPPRSSRSCSIWARRRHMYHNSKQSLKELKTGKDSGRIWLPNK
ncbi:MAG TPA: nitroreductase family protein [Anaerolineales bacterium]|nr:nitroreductase family protein [Anaerolineales bacterium]